MLLFETMFVLANIEHSIQSEKHYGIILSFLGGNSPSPMGAKAESILALAPTLPHFVYCRKTTIPANPLSEKCTNYVYFMYIFRA